MQTQLHQKIDEYRTKRWNCCPRPTQEQVGERAGLRRDVVSLIEGHKWADEQDIEKYFVAVDELVAEARAEACA